MQALKKWFLVICSVSLRRSVLASKEEAGGLV